MDHYATLDRFVCLLESGILADKAVDFTAICNRLGVPRRPFAEFLEDNFGYTPDEIIAIYRNLR